MAISGIRWHLNLDVYAQQVDPTVRYTRNPPPERPHGAEESGVDVFEITGYTPAEQFRGTCVHEAAHAVLRMNVGHRVKSITVPPVGGRELRSVNGQTVVEGRARGPWLDFAIATAGGERAEDRWLREVGLWNVERAWVVERQARGDRADAVEMVRAGLDEELTFYGYHEVDTDYAWICDRADEALNMLWPRVIALGRYLAEHHLVDGATAARIAGFDPATAAATER